MKILKILLFVVAFTFVKQSYSKDATKWIDTFSEAKQISEETGKPIILLFSGSDWCKPCIKLKNYILESDEFANYSSKFVLYNADFPYRIKQPKELVKQNETLAEQYNPKGEFPKVVYIDKNGKVLGSTGFIDCEPSAYIQKIEKVLHK